MNTISPSPLADDNVLPHFCPHCLSTAAPLRPQHSLMLDVFAKMQARRINLDQLLAAVAAHLGFADGAPRQTRILLTRIFNSPTLDLSAQSGAKALRKRLALLQAVAAVLGMDKTAVSSACDSLLLQLQAPLPTAAERLAAQKAKRAAPLQFYLKKDVTLTKAWGFDGQHHARRFYTGFEIALPADFAELDAKQRLSLARHLVAQKFAAFDAGPDRHRAIMHGYYLCNNHDGDYVYIPCPRPQS